MKKIDLIKIMFLAGTVYAYIKGYGYYQQGEGETCVAWTMLCALSLLLFFHRLIRGKVSQDVHEKSRQIKRKNL